MLSLQVSSDVKKYRCWPTKGDTGERRSVVLAHRSMLQRDISRSSEPWEITPPQQALDDRSAIAESSGLVAKSKLPISHMDLPAMLRASKKEEFGISSVESHVTSKCIDVQEWSQNCLEEEHGWMVVFQTLELRWANSCNGFRRIAMESFVTIQVTGSSFSCDVLKWAIQTPTFLFMDSNWCTCTLLDAIAFKIAMDGNLSCTSRLPEIAIVDAC